MLRIERVAEEWGSDLDAVRAEVSAARGNRFAGLKTIAAYRGGLDLDALGEPARAGRLEGRPLREAAGRARGERGDRRSAARAGALRLRRLRPRPPARDPGLLKPLVERFAGTPWVLLHSYPYVREAGWMAHVYGHVWFDLSLTIPHVSRPAEMVRQALELAPVSKLLYASDAARAPELYLFGARRWRRALAEVLAEALPPDEAEAAGRMVLRENAIGLYQLE